MGPFVRDFVEKHSPWEGTASELLTALETLAHGGVTTGGVTMQVPKVGSDVTKQKAWPKNGRALSNILRRLAPTLRAVGVDVQLGDGAGRTPGTGKRLIKLTTLTPQPPASHGRVQGTI